MSRPADPHAKIDLLRAAEEVFVARGVDLAKVEDITALAGHSKGAFYLHFASKEDAFRQLIENLLARLSACVDGAHHTLNDVEQLAHPERFLEQWRAHDLEIWEFVWQNRRLVRLLLAGGMSASFTYLIDEFAERSRAATKHGLHLGVSAGLYRADLDVELASLAIAGAYDRVARHLVRAERKPDLARLAGEVQRFVVAGIAAPALARVIASEIDQPVRNRRSRRA